MRKLVRTASPDCLRADAPEWSDDYLAARKADPRHPFSWRSQRCYREIRRELARMTQEHCAFCDGQVGTESRETVEHFRPKSLFPALAYQWDNLFLCCDLCQSSKNERFNEGLLRPDDADYQFATYFVANFHTGAIEPSPAADEAARVRAQVTIELYALNVPARKKARKREWERFSRDSAAHIDDYSYRYFLE